MTRSRLFIRLGMWFLTRARIPSIQCVCYDTLYVVAYVVDVPKAECSVPALLVGAAQTFCDARGVPMPKLSDVTPVADVSTVH